jgi:hypothetical protein
VLLEKAQHFIAMQRGMNVFVMQQQPQIKAREVLFIPFARIQPRSKPLGLVQADDDQRDQVPDAQAYDDVGLRLLRVEMTA